MPLNCCRATTTPAGPGPQVSRTHEIAGKPPAVPGHGGGYKQAFRRYLVGSKLLAEQVVSLL